MDYSNLLSFTARLTGEEEVHDNLTGVSALAGNGVEAAIASTYETLNFTHWIGDILDGYQQEKGLRTANPEAYNQNQENIRASITKINNLAHTMGFEGDVIPTPRNGEEVSAAASAVYNLYALPYQAQKNQVVREGEKPFEIDYAKYTQMQMQQNPLAESIRELNTQVAQSDQYGKVAANYWELVTKAAKGHKALNSTYLIGMDMIHDYTKQMKEYESYLGEEIQLSEAGMSETQMGGGTADKIDFENDDAGLRKEMSQTLLNMKRMLKREESMLAAGHIDTKRLTMFSTIMADYAMDLKKQKSKIDSDNIEDTKATAELAEKIETKPKEVRQEEIKAYMDMLQKQEKEPATLNMTGIQDDISKYLGLAKQLLIVANVAAIPSATGVEQLLRMGKFFYDAHSMSEKTEAKEVVKEISIEENLDYDKQASDIRVASAAFANGFRDIMREHIGPADGQMDESDELYSTLTNKINDVLAAEEIDDERRTAGCRDALGLLGATAASLGSNLFGKPVDQMSDEEVLTHARAIRNVMYPLKEKNDYLHNFADFYAVGVEDMNDWHKEITDNMQNAMLVNDTESAINFRKSGRMAMNAAQRQNEYDKDNTTVVSMDDPEQAEINNQLKEADELYKQALATYTPLFQKVALTGMAAAYKKHEYNKAWKESIRERNFNLMCEGTLKAMEESQRESEMIADRALRGPGGLLA